MPNPSRTGLPAQVSLGYSKMIRIRFPTSPRDNSRIDPLLLTTLRLPSRRTSFVLTATSTLAKFPLPSHFPIGISGCPASIRKTPGAARSAIADLRHSSMAYPQPQMSPRPIAPRPARSASLCGPPARISARCFRYSTSGLRRGDRSYLSVSMQTRLGPPKRPTKSIPRNSGNSSKRGN